MRIIKMTQTEDRKTQMRELGEEKARGREKKDTESVI